MVLEAKRNTKWDVRWDVVCVLIICLVRSESDVCVCVCVGAQKHFVFRGSKLKSTKTHKNTHTKNMQESTYGVEHL